MEPARGVKIAWTGVKPPLGVLPRRARHRRVGDPPGRAAGRRWLESVRPSPAHHSRMWRITVAPGATAEAPHQLPSGLRVFDLDDVDFLLRTRLHVRTGDHPLFGRPAGSISSVVASSSAAPDPSPGGEMPVGHPEDSPLDAPARQPRKPGWGAVGRAEMKSSMPSSGHGGRTRSSLAGSDLDSTGDPRGADPTGRRVTFSPPRKLQGASQPRLGSNRTDSTPS